MQRRSFLKNATAGAAAATIAAPAIAQAPQIRWRCSSSFPKSLDTLVGAGELFVKKVSEATGGRFQISLHAGGEITPPFAVVDAVQQGTIECGHTAPYYFFGKDPTFALDTAIPFGMNARQMNAWMYEGNGMALLREFYKPYNIINFPMGNTGAQMGGWYRKEIKSIDDIKGLKMRIGGFGGTVLAQDGCRAAEPSRRRGLSGARKRHDRRYRMGWAVRRREAWLSTRLPSSITTLHGGRAARRSSCTSIRPPGTNCRRSIRRSSKSRRDWRIPTCWRVMTLEIPSRFDVCRQRTQLRAFSRPIMEAAWKAANEHLRRVERQAIRAGRRSMRTTRASATIRSAGSA